MSYEVTKATSINSQGNLAIRAIRAIMVPFERGMAWKNNI